MQLIVFANKPLPVSLILSLTRCGPQESPTRTSHSGTSRYLNVRRENNYSLLTKAAPPQNHKAAAFAPIVFLLTATSDISRVLIRELSLPETGIHRV